MNQFQLLRQRRFGPFFGVQFLGAFNDNVYRNALIILIAFELARTGGDASSHIMVNAAAGLFILPFFLFSATAGQIADRYEKAWLIRRIKFLELVIMSLAAVALLLKSLWVLIALLFLMGMQSSIFGPVKYAILPQHLDKDELVGGNGMVEMGTFLAILLGTVVGGLLIAISGYGPLLVAIAVVAIALAGWWVAQGVPTASAAAPELRIRWNILAATWANLGLLWRDPVQWLTALGISWFWFYGSTLLTQIPNFTRLSLSSNAQVVTLLLTTFSLGIGLGSLLVEGLSRRQIVPWVCLLGGLGMLGFGSWLPWLANDFPAAESLRTASEFIAVGGWPILAGVLGLGIAGGLYIVPLFALVQRRAQLEHRAQVIAGVNILNALFMVASALISGALLGSGWSIPELFGLVAAIHALVLLGLAWALKAQLGSWAAVPETQLS
nr:MFS transporter [Oceanococcus sp. HetDA_MAG_MS8]